MIPPRFKLYFQTYKKTLLLLVLAQLACVGLYAAAMKVLASITDSVFLKQNTLQEAAPVLLVLLLLFFLREIILYLQKGRLRKTSLHCRQQLRQKLHRHMLAQPQTPDDSPQLLTLACESIDTLDDDCQILLPTSA